MSQRAAVVP
jgi:hypothetical protein